jgi:hypothetical protein
MEKVGNDEDLYNTNNMKNILMTDLSYFLTHRFYQKLCD